MVSHVAGIPASKESAFMQALGKHLKPEQIETIPTLPPVVPAV